MNRKIWVWIVGLIFAVLPILFGLTASLFNNDAAAGAGAGLGLFYLFLMMFTVPVGGALTATGLIYSDNNSIGATQASDIATRHTKLAKRIMWRGVAFILIPIVVQSIVYSLVGGSNMPTASYDTRSITMITTTFLFGFFQSFGVISLIVGVIKYASAKGQSIVK